jgi:neutral ceramidase
MTATDSGPARGDEWEAGTATQVITPEESLWLAGFAARDAPADGTETDLHARALAVRDRDGEAVVLVSVEVVSIPPGMRDSLERRCTGRYGLEPASVAFAATHTHCGPLLQEFRGRIYDVDEELIDASLAYRRRLEDALVDLVGDALEAREPATLSYGRARCGFAINRRQPTSDGIANGLHPDGPVDHDVPVLAVESVGGNDGDALEAIVFGYACHATTLRLRRYCGDWPGYAMVTLEERYPDATALFLTGCAGDQNPHPTRRLEAAGQHGTAMANAVETALDAPRRPLRGPLRLAHESILLEFEGYDGRDELEELRSSADLYERRHADLLLERLDNAERESLATTYPYRMRAVGFGSGLTLLTLAGEVVVDYALAIRDEIPGPLWIAAYTDGSFTYVPSRRVLAEGGYEGGGVTRFRRYPGRLTPDVEDRIRSAARALVARVRST